MEDSNSRRLIHLSDIHLDASNRFEDTNALLKDLVQRGGSYKPDLWVVAGDNYPVSVRESKPIERTTLKYHFRRMAAHAPVVVLRGNHDHSAYDLEILHDPEKGIHVFSEPDVVAINGIIVGAVPWPSKGYLLSQLPDDTPQTDVDASCRQAMKGILSGMKLAFHAVSEENAATAAPRVLVGHLNVTGAGRLAARHDIRFVNIDAPTVGAFQAEFAARGWTAQSAGDDS